jgi:hypothetical protein
MGGKRARKATGASDFMPRLEQALGGLLYPSETDAPVKTFVWSGETPFSQQALLAHRGDDEKTPVRTISLAQFFDPVTTPQAWHEEAERERTTRFAALRELLESELDDIAVYKIGSVKADVYVVGRTAEGTYCGITTQVVET